MPILRIFILTLLLNLIFAPANSFAARVKGKIKGESPSQYTVLTVSKNGRSTVSTVATNGSFSVNAKQGTTLHLIGSDSRYFGPIVAAKGARAYPSLSGKAGSLGGVSVKSAFATVPYGKAKNVISAKKLIDFDSTSGPTGAGKLGLVLAPPSAVPQSANVGANADSSQIGEDSDEDGLPDILDIDDDGDLVLDISDSASAATPDYTAKIAGTLRTTLAGSVNKNISGVTDDEVDTALSEGLIFGFTFRSNLDAVSVDSVNIDCGTLSYCAPETGSATIRSDNLSQLEDTLWINYDDDSDGFPNLNAASTPPYIGVHPKASRAQLRPGDTLFFNADTSGGSFIIPSVLPFYFVTAPALKSYTSGSESRTLSYPISGGAEGTAFNNPFPLGASSVSLTFWKPQRPAVEGAEDGDYIDNGKLGYGLTLSVQNNSSVFTCTSSEYSNPSSGLTANTTAAGGTVEAFEDTAADAAVNSDNVLSFTVDLGTCLSRQGVATSRAVVMVDLNATSLAGDQTSQSFFVQLP